MGRVPEFKTFRVGPLTLVGKPSFFEMGGEKGKLFCFEKVFKGNLAV